MNPATHKRFQAAVARAFAKPLAQGPPEPPPRPGRPKGIHTAHIVRTGKPR
jgi:hypothetical protein